MCRASTLLLPLGGILALLSLLNGQNPPLDPARLRVITDRMRELIGEHEIPGAVTLVETRDAVVHLAAVGFADPAGKTLMRTNSLFWIASMTKPITATAVMMLQEAGKLSVDDPVSKYLPEMANLKMADGSPANVTLRHLLTHTSGMSEATAEEAREAKTLADLIPAFVAKPVQFEPGSRWQYCQSGINTLGRIVEVVSGQSFPEYLARRLFRPLGMKDTTFYPTAKQMRRYVTPAKREGDELVATQIGLLGSKEPTSRDRYPAANGGLFSTAPDYARFARMILNGGTLDGKRYLSPESVQLMTSVQTSALTTGFTPGNGWGLGWCVVREPQGVTAMLSPGSFGHGGAYGTQVWIDPQRGVAVILMVQRSNFPNADASEVRRVFQKTALGK
jgi:CubicO group peptidase (beta-lactamase class C family)